MCIYHVHVNESGQAAVLDYCMFSNVENVQELARQWKKRQRERDGGNKCLEAARYWVKQKLKQH